MLLQQDQRVPNTAGVLPLSLTQEGLWFFEHATPGTPTYNLAEAWWLEGPLDVGALQRSLDELVRRHETLRTAIGDKDGKPCQIVFPPKPFPLAVADLRSHVKAASEAERLAGLEARRAFDLTQEPLARCSLFRVSQRPPSLLYQHASHHFRRPGRSGVFLRELAFLYGWTIRSGSRICPFNMAISPFGSAKCRVRIYPGKTWTIGPGN